MKKVAFILAACLLAIIAPAHAQVSELTAIIIIDNRNVSIPVDDLDSCYRAIENHVNGLRFLYQNNYTVTSVIGECFDRGGRLLAAGRCGVRPQSGQITLLCTPQMQTFTQ